MQSALWNFIIIVVGMRERAENVLCDIVLNVYIINRVIFFLGSRDT